MKTLRSTRAHRSRDADGSRSSGLSENNAAQVLLLTGEGDGR